MNQNNRVASQFFFSVGDDVAIGPPSKGVLYRNARQFPQIQQELFRFSIQVCEMLFMKIFIAEIVKSMHHECSRSIDLAGFHDEVWIKTRYSPPLLSDRR